MRRNFQGHTFSSRQSNISVHLNQLDSFSWPNFGFSKNFYRFYPNHSFYDSSHHTDFSNFKDYNFSDCDKSKHYFNFSDNDIPHPSLDQSFEAFHLQYSRSSRNRRFDKQRRKRSFRGGLGRSDSPHPMHYPIDLSSRNDTHTDEIRLLSKGPSFCPIPRDINWHKCRLDWQAFVDKVRWADYYFGREPTHNSNTSVTLLDDLGSFKIKSNVRAPVSKDIALETFLATVENKLFDAERARREPKANISRAENMALCKLRKSKDIVVRLQDKGSRFVILDRNDYIDKVESNLSDGSFDILSSDPSLSFYHTVKDWGDKWVEKGEITQPLVDCILNVNARPGKNYGLIKTHKPNNPIRLITSGNGTAVENLSLFTEYFLHPCVKKEPQILIDRTALLNKIADINNKFSPFPVGALLVLWDVI